MNDNSKKIILDLCGGTGAWSEPYRKAGYTVYNITLPNYDVANVVLGRTIVFLHYIDGSISIPLNDVYGILAAPPCTMFSRARTTAKTPRDLAGAMAVVGDCLRIIWYCRAYGNLQFWALENPMGLLRQFLGNPGYSFRGWEFGDDHVKFTDLWGYFKKPKELRHVEPIMFNQAKYASPKKPKKYAHLKLNRAAIRAITPTGFAEAFYKANK